MIAALLLCGIAQAGLPTSFEVFTVTANHLRMRSSPEFGDNIVRLLKKGSGVLIIERKGEWARVYANGAPPYGWVHGSYLKGADPRD